MLQKKRNIIKFNKDQHVFLVRDIYGSDHFYTIDILKLKINYLNNNNVIYSQRK